MIRITVPYPEGLSCDVVVLIAGGAKRDLGTNPQAEILKHRVENERVVIQMQVDAACFARLAYAHYPYLQVRVDGKEVESWPTAGGFIAIELAAGRHQIELVPYLSPLRKAMLGILLVLLVVSGGNLWWWFSRG